MNIWSRGKFMEADYLAIVWVVNMEYPTCLGIISDPPALTFHHHHREDISNSFRVEVDRPKTW